MSTTRTCSWCHEMNTVDAGEPTFCTKCGHRVDVARRYCTCTECRRARDDARWSRAARAAASAQAQCERWNASVPVGTDVDVRLDDGTVRHTRTRSEAWVICDHASVLVDGISGGYLIDRVTVAHGAPT